MSLAFNYSDFFFFLLHLYLETGLVLADEIMLKDFCAMACQHLVDEDETRTRKLNEL